MDVIGLLELFWFIITHPVGVCRFVGVLLSYIDTNGLQQFDMEVE